MDSQLKEILDTLHQQDITYWLDSGTLLGLMRDGQLLMDDKDIDIGTWASEEDKIKAIIPHFRKAGYQIYSATYKKETFKYSFVPHKRKNLRAIDINLFRKADENAWCPMYYFKLSPTQTKTKARKGNVLGTTRALLRSCWKNISSRIDLCVAIDSYPWQPFLNTGTWWIPGKFYKDTNFNDHALAYIPGEWETYLAFRYGNWQQPDKDWVFYRDDKGINHMEPASLISFTQKDK
jgi:hypothetical protein